MSENSSETSEYIHGSSPEERRRLSLLNEILNDSCLSELNLQPGETVLDFGCGLGQFTRRIAQAVGASGRVMGIERDLDQLQQARQLAAEAGEADLVDFRQGDVLDPPLELTEWGAFDVVHARFLLEHIPQPERVVEQMARAVRPGGRVIVVDDDHGDFRPWPEPSGFSELWQAYVTSFERLGADPYVGRKLVTLLRSAGLTPKRNGGVFFGGCAGDDRFQAIADNLIGAFEGARNAMTSTEELDETAFEAGMASLRDWKADPNSALWYSACFAEAVKPG